MLQLYPYLDKKVDSKAGKEFVCCRRRHFMRTRKIKRMLRESYGKVPDPYYFDGDMNYIRAYYDFRRDNGLDPFLIDEITWHDLDMDRVFKRINPKRCPSGEQYLYYMLRSPAVDAASYEQRKALIHYAASAAPLSSDGWS